MLSWFSGVGVKSNFERLSKLLNYLKTLPDLLRSEWCCLNSISIRSLTSNGSLKVKAVLVLALWQLDGNIHSEPGETGSK